ncbi:MAG: acyltransferase domain-containing protein [Candidatus Rhabdochlamydia sp.]
MKTWIFAGQGTQKIGMGSSLFSFFTKECEKASEILGYSIIELCTEDPKNQLTLTEFAQPAIFFVNALLFLSRIQTEEKPIIVCGHSLGEYNALHAAGVIDLYDGLSLIKARGQAMAKITDGGMVAVIGQPINQIQEILLENDLFTIDIANYNSSKQLIISGPKEDLQIIIPLLEGKGFRCVSLNVSGPFHSRYMEKARIEFTQKLINFDFKPPIIQIVSPTTIEFVEADFLIELLSFQLTKPIYWIDAILKIMNLGCKEFLEFSPGDEILTRLISQISEDRNR